MAGAMEKAEGTSASSRPLLGAHISIAGGVSQALGRGRDAGCECIQIFTKSSRQWAAKPYPREEIEGFRAAQRESGIKLVVAHDSYLVNLGATDETLRKKSIAGVIDELERCEQLGIPFLIAHPGAHVGAGEEAGIRNIARAIDEAHTACPGYRVRLALEITAGQGSNLGYKFEQMGQIIDAVADNGRLRLCFDTEHAFAAGYDLRDDEGYERTFAELDQHVGLELLAAFHINDSMKPLNSRVDRHEHIGKGHLGLEPFRRLVNDPRFVGVPMCLETEPGPEMHDIIEDLQQLHRLLKAAA
ncbi:MAG TPA: deoxyribonuclease IV [Candidatus Binataceae bacterium]|nr:deoxyribonuclease IV [Candidatus Binataceae bacterium]